MTTSVQARPRQAVQLHAVTLADGRRIGCLEHAGAGEPFVLLHGMLDSSAGWGEFAAAQKRPCYAFDLPGFGSSDMPTCGRLSAYARDIEEAIELLEIPTPFTIVGHSFGGAVATALSDRIPDSISAMFLLAPAGFGRIRLAEAVSLPLVRHVAERALPLALARRLPVTLAYRSFVTNNVAPKRDVVDRVTQSDAKTVAAAVCVTQAIVAAGLSERAFHRRRMHFSGPVTALWGTRDRLVPPEHSRGVETAFPQARIVKFPGMGHHPQRERLDEIMELIDLPRTPEATVTPLPRPAPAGAPFIRLRAA